MPITNDSPTDPRRRVRVAPGVFLRGGRYSVSYTDDEGLHHHKTTEAKNITEAKAIREKKRVAVREGTAVSPSKVTFAEVTVEYLAVFGSLVSAGERSPRTLERYRENIDRHLLPAFGRREIQKIKPDAVARFLNEKRSAGLSAWSRKGMLTPLRRIFGLAVRRGYISESPLRRLDPSELPKGQNQTEARVLSRDELAALVQHTPETYRPVIATLALTGMRIQEALGLVWSDIDFEAGVIRLCYQLTRATRAEPARRVRLKTDKARRDIRLEPELVALLRRHKLSSPFSQDEDYVFTTETGRPVYYRNVAIRGLDKAADRAGLNRDGLPRLSPHDLRHSYASLLILQGLDVVRVSRQLGHARPSITLDIYAHLFEEAQYADDVSLAVTAAFKGVL